MDPTARCAGCGTLLVSGARYCHACGHPAAQVAAARSRCASPAQDVAPPPVVGERRFATCLFADLVDYTAICAGCDAEEVQEMLRRWFEAVDGLVAASGGHVVDHAGDALLAVYGAPVAHGDDAVRAVEAAARLHELAAGSRDPLGRPLRLHVGCASGEVVVSTIAVGGAVRPALTGEAVNLAARLSARSAAGESLLSDACHVLVDHRVHATPLDGLLLKGVPVAVRAWRIDALLPADADAPPLLGRGEELAAWRARLRDAREAGGPAVALSGEAGIGKSRMVAEMCGIARAAGFATRVVHADAVGVGDSRGIGALLAALAPHRDAHDRGAVVEWLLEVYGPPQEGAASVAAALRVALGHPLDAADRQALDGLPHAALRATLSRVAAAAVRAACARQPLVLVVEDVHAVPAELRGWLDRFGAQARVPGFVFVTTARPGAAAPPAPDSAGTVRFDLVPLTPGESEILAHRFCTVPAIVGRCVERARGNPLFLEALMRAARIGATAELPGTVQAAVASRVDRLDGTLRAVLQAASVLGPRFDRGTLETLVEPGCLDLGPVEALGVAGLIRVEDGALAFTHALIHEAVYASLLNSRRQALHRRAAAVVRDAVERAEHLLRASDPSAAAAFLGAAESALHAHDPDAAAALAARAALAPCDETVRARLAIVHGRALLESGRTADASRTLDRALSRALDPGHADALRLEAAEVHRVTADYAAAHAMLDTVVATDGRPDSDAVLARAHSLRGALHFAQGRAAACRQAHEEALAHARRAGDAVAELRAVSGLGDAAYALGRHAEAATRFEQAFELARRTGRPTDVLSAAAMRGRALSFMLRLDEARDCIRGAVVEAGGRGPVIGEAIAALMLANVQQLRGEPDAAIAAARDAIARAEALCAARFEAFGWVVLAVAAGFAGRADEARAAARTAVALSRRIGMSVVGPNALGALAMTATTASERAAALDEGEAVLSGTDAAFAHHAFRRLAIEATLIGRDWGAVRFHASALEARFGSSPPPLVELVVARARALADAGESPGPDTDRAVRQVLRRIRSAGASGLSGARSGADAATGVR